MEQLSEKELSALNDLLTDCLLYTSIFCRGMHSCGGGIFPNMKRPRIKDGA